MTTLGPGKCIALGTAFVTSEVLEVRAHPVLPASVGPDLSMALDATLCSRRIQSKRVFNGYLGPNPAYFQFARF